MSDDAASPEELLKRLRSGDQAAATELFRRFARRLIGLARAQLDSRLRHKVDPEDVVQSVFRSFFMRHQEGQFQVRDWDNLWSLLAMITVRKCTNVRVSLGRQARNVHREIRIEAGPDDSSPGWEALARDPTPAEAVALTELIDKLLGALSERERQMVTLSLEGKDARAISEVVGRAERTVRRTVDHFRQRLEHALHDPDSVF
jgi:RNA polymerase sigma-70 factor (ECF subfamily)